MDDDTGAWGMTGARGGTHRPLREPQVGLAPSLGEDALVLLQAAAHGARGDGEVAVVAVSGRVVSWRVRT